jgi:amino acid permease
VALMPPQDLLVDCLLVLCGIWMNYYVFHPKATLVAGLAYVSNQHPEMIANCFPLCFLSFVYQNDVPTVVTQLEGDRTKITKAIIAGTTTLMLMFLAWNAVVLGNVMGTDLTDMNPVVVLQSGASGSP